MKLAHTDKIDGMLAIGGVGHAALVRLSDAHVLHATPTPDGAAPGAVEAHIAAVSKIVRLELAILRAVHADILRGGSDFVQDVVVALTRFQHYAAVFRDLAGEPYFIYLRLESPNHRLGQIRSRCTAIGQEMSHILLTEPEDVLPAAGQTSRWEPMYEPKEEELPPFMREDSVLRLLGLRERN